MMTDLEIEEDFKLFPEYFKHVLNTLEANAYINLRSMKNKRNYNKDPYYDNYDRFTPMYGHNYCKSITEYRKMLSKKLVINN